MNLFERHESAVRSYCRSFPAVFERAEGCTLFDRDGRPYLDFFAGAGVLNYGHNPPELKEPLLEYISGNGVTHSLDFYSVAKEEFLAAFVERILRPRGLDYKLQFPGPTGTNAVEAALKLARKVTGRSKVISFTNGFHGMTLGSLAITGNEANRAGAGVPLGNVNRMPFDGYLGEGGDELEFLDSMLSDGSSGVDKPAAAILETVQAEGGVNVASAEWLRRLAAILKRHEVLLIVDDIQVGCGRTGPFFSFEEAGIVPDLVCLSKSLSGYGLPLALVLLRPELDVWKPGEHNGTFRGHNLAFVTARAAAERWWSDDALERRVARRADVLSDRLAALAAELPEVVEARGRGLIQGLELEGDLAGEASARAFEQGLIVETAGASGQVLKCLPPLVLDEEELAHGLDIIESSVRSAIEALSPRARRTA